MFRLCIFLFGMIALLLGAAPNFPQIPLPFNPQDIVWSISLAHMSLDVLLMVVGVFLIIISWLFTRLAQP